MHKFNDKKVQAAVRSAFHEIADSGRRRRILCFAVSTAHADAICEEIGDERVRRIHSNVGTLKEVQDTLAWFKADAPDETRMLVTVMMMAEGVDLPKVDCLFMVRPTFSSILHRQMLGRGLRGPSVGGTPDCAVVDFTVTFLTPSGEVRQESGIAERGYDVDSTEESGDEDGPELIGTACFRCGQINPVGRCHQDWPHVTGRWPARAVVAAAGPEPAEESFPTLDDEAQVREVHRALLGRGPLARDESVRTAASVLRDQGQVSYERLRGNGAVYQLVDRCIEQGLKEGRFDRPARGQIRAIWTEPASYPTWLWQRCVLWALTKMQWIDRDEAVANIAAWAREHLALEYQILRREGRVDTGIRQAITACLRKKLLEADGSSIRRTGGAEEIEIRD